MSFYTCGPNEAMVVSGCCHGQPQYVAGGRVFVIPAIQKIQKISLNTITTEVTSPRVYTKLGVPISVTGIAQVKIEGRNKEMLASACQQFLGKNEHQIQQIALETLEGHQRAIMGLMTVEEIYQDRQKFSEKVFEVASSDLVNMGITVVSYTLKDIRDEEEAQAEELRLEAKFKNDILIAQAKRDYEVQQATFDEEVNRNKARADLAYQLQAAKTQQMIMDEEMEVKVIERAQQIELQKQEIARRERELDATIRRPAEAEKFRLEKIAQAERVRIVLEAEASAEADRVQGQAKAYAIEVEGQAQAEQMLKKAEAWKEYKEAAMVDMALNTLPKVAAEVAHPLASGLNELKLISTGDGPIGIGKLTGEVMDVMARLPQIVNQMTNADISKAIKAK